ncbi:GNAT family N-acetyltransferase [Microlunatus sp. GCM10028923]|uniref:GNAT family N-acetyltransferase n=1 Tax=Microlunatus sp. GCM10028923 TaxID=3273400 RepID=UPI00361C703B
MRRLTDTDSAIAYSTDLLRSDRIYLREVRDEDLGQFTRWWNDPATLTLQQSTARPVPEGATVDRFREWTRTMTLQDFGLAVVRASDDTLIGQAGLKLEQYGRSAEFVIVLGPEYTSQGYGTEAVRLMLRFGFAELGLHRIELWVWAYNTRAIAAYRSAGFIEEGRRRDVAFHNGQYCDEVIMSVLENEWRRSAERQQDSAS